MESTEERKNRLKRMREEAGLPEGESEAKKEVTLKFRNYIPQDKSIKHEIIAAPPSIDVSETIQPVLDSVEKHREISGVEIRKGPTGFVKDPSQESAIEAPTFRETETPLAELAPKKANWDLKRDVEKKLNKLRKRTDRAILEMLREKVQEEQAMQGDIGDANAIELEHDTTQGEHLISGINAQAKDMEDSDEE